MANERVATKKVSRETAEQLMTLRLYAKLLDNELSREAMAEKLGVSIDMLKSWESGPSRMPLEHARKYLKVLVDYYTQKYDIDPLKREPYRTEGEKLVWLMAKYKVTWNALAKELHVNTVKCKVIVFAGGLERYSNEYLRSKIMGTAASTLIDWRGL